MAPTVAPTDLDNLEQLFVQAFQTLHKSLQAAEAYDREHAKQGVEEIRRRESFFERSCSSEKEVRKFLERGEEVIREMWRRYTRLTECYTGQLRQHQNVPRTLHDVSTMTWQEVTKSLQPISRDLTERMQQNHWKGRGADDYMKQLPMQLSAVTEFGQFVDAATIGVDVPGQLQALVFAAGSTEILSAAGAIGRRSSDAGRGMYFTECAKASGILAREITWWNNELMTGKGSWRMTLDNHIREMTSSQVRNPQVLKGDRWPRATKDTTDIPRPGSSPIVDRQGMSGVRGADRSGAGGGVNQGDYHQEDKGGRIW